MRITIEIPDDQVPQAFFNKLYPSGYGEDDLQYLLIGGSILHRLHMLKLLAAQSEMLDSEMERYQQQSENEIAFLEYIAQNMKIESGGSKEKVLIDGLTEVAKDWYDGCPKSMKFVTRVLQLLKSYNRNSDET